jgi:hypothetical protein
MKTHHIKLSIAVSFAAISSFAHAGFLFETSPAPVAAPAAQSSRANAPSSADVAPVGARNVDTSARLDRVAKMNRQRIDLESRLTSRITQSGETPAELGILRGMGRDVTLEDALRQILPSGWSAYSDQDLPLESKVSWSGNRTWPMVLSALLAERDMRAHVDWKNQEVMFFVPAVKEELTTPVAGAPGVEVRVTEAPADTEAADKPPGVQAQTVAAKVEVKEVIWTLSPEHTLRENLRRWASAANWNLVWNAVKGDSVIDYPVDAKVEFAGELLGAEGAMAKVITAYRDADYPLEIEFFRGNRVVEIRLHRIPDIKASATAAPVVVAPRVPLPQPVQVTTPSSIVLGN